MKESDDDDNFKQPLTRVSSVGGGKKTAPAIGNST
jgi:hypothetical protein